MSYHFTNLTSQDYIGNSLSSVNINYSNLSNWTNTIQFSSDRFFEPLRQFYLFYGDFWKDTVSYAYSIDGPKRLTSFNTHVAENSAKWINPIVFYYPEILKYDQSTIDYTISIASNWFYENYPVLNNQIAVVGAPEPLPNFVENTVAYLYIIFYDEQINKIKSNTTLISGINCQTNDTAATVNCWVTFVDDIGCYGDRHACGRFSRTPISSPTSPSCQRIFDMNCKYENNLQSITRSGILNVDSQFSDRSENENIMCLVFEVKNCEWQFIKTI